MNSSAPGPRPSDGLGGFFDSIRRIGISRAPDRWIGGVASGIGVRLGIDALVVRGILLVMTLFGGLGLLLYGVAWALLPEATDGRIHLQEAIRGRFDAALAGAILFALIGASRVGFWWGGWVNLPITFGLLALSGLIIVIVLAVRASSRNDGTVPPGPGHTPPGLGAPPPGPGSTPSSGPFTPPPDEGTSPDSGGTPPGTAAPAQGPHTGQTAAAGPPEAAAPDAGTAAPAPQDPPAEQADAVTDAYGAGWAGDRTATTGHGAPADTGGPWAAAHETPTATTTYQPGTPTPPPPPPRPRRRGPGHGLVRATWGFALVAVAAIVLGAEYYHWQTSPWLLGLGGALAIFGLGVCVAGFLGRRSGSLSFMGVLLVVILLPWTFVAHAVNSDDSFWNPVNYGQMRWEPDSAAEAAEGFDGLAAGELTVDLEGLQGVDVATPIDIRVGVGEATLLVPDGMPIEITTDVQGGVTTRGLDGWTAQSHGRESELNSYTDLGWQIGTGMDAELRSPEAEKASDPIQVNVDVDLGAIDIREVS